MSALTPGPSPADAPRPATPPRERGVNRPLKRQQRAPSATSEMKQAARELRSAQTRSEDIFWNAIRGRKIGHKFRRQHPLGRFVLDFYCDEQRLAVEIDGPVHEASRQADAERDSLLNSYGIRVVRIPSSLVETNLGYALEIIKDSITRHPSPTPFSSSHKQLPSPAEVVGGEGHKRERGRG